MGLTCPKCGTALKPDALGGLCPACLLRNLADDSGNASMSLPDRGSGLSFPLRGDPRLQPGQSFGAYEIESLLGRGGMGDVYTARHKEHGRRVALKLLSQELRDPTDRQRFLREGELAAAINHPHCVYVYGSEEILGVPVISMELLPGGTLKDRVKTRGPLATAESVDLVLQIIAGLNSAQQCGVLHRDVKPSNCFVDSDGTVKIGDFGLSIPSTPAPASTHERVFHGTPGFAAPEQLRGEPLDVRADIYAVGATLYYLVTGEVPGGRPGLSALAAGVEVKPPRPIEAFRRGVPKPIAAVIARCLSPAPSDRPSTYAELTEALTAFGSQSATLATISLRLAARLFDCLLLIPVLALALGSVVGSGWITDQLLALAVGLVVPAALYWAIAEGLFGVTIGKRACRLSVVANGCRPGLGRSLIRASIWAIPIIGLLALRSLGASPATLFFTAAAVVMSVLAPAVNRREPRLLHDLLTGTSVTVKRPQLASFRSEVPAAPPPNAHHRQCGPYNVVASIGSTDSGELFLGFDSRLRRQVWIHSIHGAEVAGLPVPRERRPATRLRWLNGERASLTSWDAYEFPTGLPLLSVSVPVSWTSLRRWLLDLAGDLAAWPSVRPGSLSLANLWITAHDRVKVLDFALTGSSSLRVAQSPVDLLRLVAEHGLAGRPLTALPHSAAAVIQRLRQDDSLTLDEFMRLTAASADLGGSIGWRQRGMALAAVVLTYFIAGDWMRAAVTHGSTVLGRPDVLDQDALRIASALVCALLALAWAAAWRGGFWLRAFGIAVVTSDGKLVSRTRAVCRAAIVWALVPLGAVTAAMGPAILAVFVPIAQLVVAFYATDHPERGLHDRWAGTFLVPK